MKFKIFELSVAPVESGQPHSTPIVSPPSPLSDRRWWAVAVYIGYGAYLVTLLG
jgi:hypothetical protein